MSPQRSLWTGAIFIVLAFLANTTQSVFGKYVDAQLSVQLFSFGTFLVAFVLVLLLAAVRRFRDLPTSKGGYHLLRGITGIAGFTLFIAAAQLTSLVDTNVLVNTTPIFIPILALLFLHQRVSWQVWLAIVIGFAGMVVVVRPDASILSNPGNLVALGAGFVTAIEFLAVNKLDATESPLTVLFPAVWNPGVRLVGHWPLQAIASVGDGHDAGHGALLAGVPVPIDQGLCVCQAP